MILPDADILKCIALFNKYSNSAVRSDYPLPLSTEDKQDIVDNVWTAYAAYTEQDSEDTRLEKNKNDGESHLNFVKVIWKAFANSLPTPTPSIDYQVPTIPPEPPPPPTPVSGYGPLYNWHAVNKSIDVINDTNAGGIIYGGLYNKYAIDSGILAPTGWHIPTRAEWNTLSTTLGGNIFSGGHLKETGTTHWFAPNTGADNSSSFTAIGSGFRTDVFNAEKFFAVYHWSDIYTGDGNIPNGGNGRVLISNSSQFGDFFDTVIMCNHLGASIRCIKDDSIDPGMVTDIDGNIYPTVKIGTQVWMAKNLNTTHYNSGSIIPNISDQILWDADIIGAMCYYPIPIIIGSILILAPQDWHIATYTEFQNMINAYGGWAIAGSHLKEMGLDHWITPNTGADNSTGFTGIPSGRRSNSGSYTVQGIFAYYHSSENPSTTLPYGMVLDKDSTVAGAINSDTTSYGFPVRCVKDSTILNEGEISTVTDIDGNVYPTICINGQEWLASDLATTHYKTGVLIPNIVDDTDWGNDVDGAMCWYNNVPHVVPPIPVDQIPQYYLLSDGNEIYRKGVRNQSFVIDVALTVLGFGGIEDIDWKNLEMVI